MSIRPKTTKDSSGKKFHNINGINIECSGQDCSFCRGETEISFKTWENSIPYPIPPKGKKYKNPKIQKNRGKTIMEICYTCKEAETPCYICKRTECPLWMKEEQRKGQEAGCPYWWNGKCLEFSCSYGLIKTHWEKGRNVKRISRSENKQNISKNKKKLRKGSGRKPKEK